MRHGCKSLAQIEILPKPPLDRAADNPWPEWPKVYKLDYGQEEAAAKFGADPRVYLTTAKKFNGDDAGQSSPASSPCRSSWEKNDKGQFIPVEQPGTEKEHPAQLVLLAMGFLGPEQPLLKALKVERDARRNVKAEYGKYAHQHPGRLRRRRLPPRPEPGRLGHQRRPRRRARVRPLPDGRDRTAVSVGPMPSLPVEILRRRYACAGLSSRPRIEVGTP